MKKSGINNNWNLGHRCSKNIRVKESNRNAILKSLRKSTSIPSCMKSRLFEPPRRIQPGGPTSRTGKNTSRIYAEIGQRSREVLGQHATDLHWFRGWDKVLEWTCPWAKWFVGGSAFPYNCLDRHVKAAAPPKPRSFGKVSRAKPHPHLSAVSDEVQKFANVIKGLGIQKGDRVAIYMGMVPSCRWRCWPAPASARCIRSSLAASAPTQWSIHLRLGSSRCLITQDGAHRRGSEIS